MTTPTSNATISTRIEKALPNIPKNEDRRVLEAILATLKPEAVEKRPEWDRDLTHLHDVAKYRLRPYEKTEDESHAE